MEKAIYVINCALSWFFRVSSLRLQLRNDQRVEYGFSETSHMFLEYLFQEDSSSQYSFTAAQSSPTEKSREMVAEGL